MGGVALAFLAPAPECDGERNVLRCQQQGYERRETQVLAMWGVGIVAALAAAALVLGDRRGRASPRPDRDRQGD
ncbi:MAG TPA: hypothetical protein VFH47_09370, partial [Candidatus Thermoplasmatota archaeon]|nr:hypothetical protein [Candidatus Thermoplasmatota archaeon]